LELDGLKKDLADSISSKTALQGKLATVFVGYPFSDKSSLTLNLGKDDGISSDDLVVFEKTLLGKISESLAHYSVFKTVFDPDWEFPVYVGQNLARGLFQAGSEPKVVLLSKKEKIEVGALIVSADPKLISSEFVIGQVGRIKSDESSPFFEVLVEIPYNLNDLRQVTVIKK